MSETSWPASGSGEEQVEDAPVCVADDNSGVAHSAEGSVSKEKARGELVEALLRESREELERIDLKASILLSVCSLAIAALVHAAAYLHWDPRELVFSQWFLWAGMALSGAALVALAAAVWPRLSHGESTEDLIYFGHIAQFEDLEELNAALDKQASTNPSRADHATKRLLALSRLIDLKYRCIRWGMVLFAIAVPLCTVTAVRALTI